jgi:hypothetical protein
MPAQDLPPLPRPEDRPTLAIPEAGAYLGLGRVASYKAANDGYLPTIATSEHRRLVPTAELRRILGIDAFAGTEAAS